MNKEEFVKELGKLDISITDDQLNKLEDFYNILVEENKKINLTRIVDKKDVYLKHFYDSLTLTRVVDLNSINTLCDIGSGAGFPGIVLKIVYPHLQVTLIDSLLKRVNYLNETIKKLNLTNIEAIHTRAEDYNDKQFDVVVSRAVANIEKLLTFSMHLVKDTGIFTAMKGNITEELNEEVKVRIETTYTIKTIDKFTLPIENSNRALIVIKKKH